MRALLTVLTATAALGLAETAGAATVTKVLDGDTVALKDGRTVDLLGVEVSPCYATQARTKLRQLLPRKAKVRVQGERGRPGRYLFRGKRLINAELIRAGAARAAAGDLKQAAALTSAESAAKTRTRGLWKTCPPADPRPGDPAPTGQPTPTPTPPTTGDAAKQRARTDLQGRAFIRITTTTFSSAESHLHGPLGGPRRDLRRHRRPRERPP